MQGNSEGSSVAGMANRDVSMRASIGSSAPSKQAVPKRRILVVDDNIDAGDTLALLLKLKGHDVSIARDGLQAVDMASEVRPEVILMDIGMPHLNGYDATRQIRATEHGREMFIVALTGWVQAEDIARAKDAGCSAHLVKPVDYAALDLLLASLTSAN
jgi:CheY-like chemotaxis protein